MPTTYTWRAIGLDGYPEKPGGQYECMWDIYGHDDKGRDGYNYGTVPLDSSKYWLPYNELTTEVLVEWVQEALGQQAVAIIETSVADQIAAK